MNRDEIIRMAREAGITFVTEVGVASATPEWIERFAALVAAAEREACAQIAHDTYEGFGPNAKGVDFVKQHIAIRIRERGAP